MKKQMTEKLKNKQEKGITLIALVITIVVMLILVGVTITMAVNGGLFIHAGKAASDTQNAIDAEQNLASGKVTIGESKYNSIDEYIDKTFLNEERKMDIQYTKSEGENLWSSTVTLNITFDEEIEYTLDQKKAIVAYNFDYSNYEEFKVGLCAMLGETGGTTDLYDDIVAEMGGEDEGLDTLLEMSKNILKYDEVEKLESLGVKVISIETPYNTTLYTSALGGEVACTFIENGTYTFKIKSGKTEINQEIQIDNIREYDKEVPHKVNIEFIDEGGGEVVFKGDDNSTWETVATGMKDVNSSMAFKYAYESTDDPYFIPGMWVINLDENFYKYYNNIDEYYRWNDTGSFKWMSIPSLLYFYCAQTTNLTPRQFYLYALYLGSNLSSLDYKMINLAEEMLRNPESAGLPNEAYPQYNIAKKIAPGDEPEIINLTQDAKVVVISMNLYAPL